MNQLLEAVPEPVQEALLRPVLGNTVSAWALAVGAFVLAYVALRVVKRLAVSRLERLAARTEIKIDDLITDLARHTKGLFLAVVAIYLAGRILDLSPGVALSLERLLFIAFFIQAGVWASRVLYHLIQRYLERKGEEDAPRAAVLTLFSFFGQVAVWSVVVLLSLDNLGVDVTALVAGLGVGGIAVGLALQNVLQDTFASLSIILDRPFVVGDFIVVGDHSGTVEKIGIKTTRIRSLSGEQLVLGNSDLLGSRIRNYKQMQERRALFTFGVVYQTPVEKLETIPGMVREIVESLEQTRFDRAHFKQLGDSSLDFEVVYYVLVPDYAVFMDIQQEINLRLLRRLAAEGVELAYPTRTLFVQGEGAPIKVETSATPPTPS